MVSGGGAAFNPRILCVLALHWSRLLHPSEPLFPLAYNGPPLQGQPGKLWSSPPTHACWVNRAGCVSRSRPRLLRSTSSSSNAPQSVREDKGWGPSQATLLPRQVQLPSKGSRRGEHAGECVVTPAQQHMVTPLLHLLNNKACPVPPVGSWRENRTLLVDILVQKTRMTRPWGFSSPMQQSQLVVVQSSPRVFPKEKVIQNKSCFSEQHSSFVAKS